MLMHPILLNPRKIGPDGNLYVFGFTPTGTQSIYNLKFGSQTIGPSGSNNKGYFAIRYDMSTSSWGWSITAHSNHQHIDASNHIQSSQIGPNGELCVFGFTPTGTNWGRDTLQFGSQAVSPSGSSKKWVFCSLLFCYLQLLGHIVCTQKPPTYRCIELC